MNRIQFVDGLVFIFVMGMILCIGTTFYLMLTCHPSFFFGIIDIILGVLAIIIGICLSRSGDPRLDLPPDPFGIVTWWHS